MPDDDRTPFHKAEDIGPILGPLPEIEVRTREGPLGSPLGPAVVAGSVRQRLLTKAYPENVVEDLYLLHTASVIRAPSAEGGGERGRYAVRVWLETETDEQLQSCYRVLYRLHDTFGPSRSVIATETRASNFELELRIHGEFTIIACVERMGASPVWLTRFLDLPGRPTD